MEVQTRLRNRTVDVQGEFEMSIELEEKMAKLVEASIVLGVTLIGFIIDVAILYFAWQFLPFGGTLTLKGAVALMFVVRALFPSMRTMKNPLE
jgi:hypothetical protein